MTGDVWPCSGASLLLPRWPENTAIIRRREHFRTQKQAAINVEGLPGASSRGRSDWVWVAWAMPHVWSRGIAVWNQSQWGGWVFFFGGQLPASAPAAAFTSLTPASSGGPDSSWQRWKQCVNQAAGAVMKQTDEGGIGFVVIGWPQAGKTRIKGG